MISILSLLLGGCHILLGSPLITNAKSAHLLWRVEPPNRLVLLRQRMKRFSRPRPSLIVHNAPNVTHHKMPDDISRNVSVPLERWNIELRGAHTKLKVRSKVPHFKGCEFAMNFGINFYTCVIVSGIRLSAYCTLHHKSWPNVHVVGCRWLLKSAALPAVATGRKEARCASEIAERESRNFLPRSLNFGGMQKKTYGWVLRTTMCNRGSL